MQFTLPKKKLIKALNTVKGSVSSKTYVPELSGVLIKATKEKIEFLTTSQLMSTKYTLDVGGDVEVKTEGTVLIKFSFLKDVASKVEDSSVTIFKFEENVVHLESGKFNSQLNTLNHHDFPTIVFHKEGNKVLLNKEVINRINQKVSFSAAEPSEGPRNVLSGILLKEISGELNAVATDTHRLSLLNTKQEVTPGFEIVIPNKVLKEISKFEKDGFELYYSPSQICVELDDLIFQASILEEKYPDISRFINLEPTTTVKLHPKTFLSAIQRATALSQHNQSVRINFANKLIKIQSRAKEVGASAEELKIEDISGSEIQIAANGQYLSQALSTFEKNEININMTGELKPIILTNGYEKDLIQLVLPVKVY